MPTEDLVGDDGDPVIGVWTTTSRENANGRHVQVSRLGSPLVNEVVIPYHRKDRFNASSPRDDKQFARFVTEPEVPEIVEAIYEIPPPDTPRDDLVSAFLTGMDGLNQPQRVRPAEMLRLNTVPFERQAESRLGVIGGDNNGFPNGRRLTDDVVDIALQVVEGVLLPDHPEAVETLGDGVNVNDFEFSDTFPYVALPASGSAPRGADASNSNADEGANALEGGALPDPEGPAGDESTLNSAPAAAEDDAADMATPMLMGAAGVALLFGMGWMSRRWLRRRAGSASTTEVQE